MEQIALVEEGQRVSDARAQVQHHARLQRRPAVGRDGRGEVARRAPWRDYVRIRRWARAEDRQDRGMTRAPDDLDLAKLLLGQSTSSCWHVELLDCSWLPTVSATMHSTRHTAMHEWAQLDIPRIHA